MKRRFDYGILSILYRGRSAISITCAVGHCVQKITVPRLGKEEEEEESGYRWNSFHCGEAVSVTACLLSCFHQDAIDTVLQ